MGIEDRVVVRALAYYFLIWFNPAMKTFLLCTSVKSLPQSLEAAKKAGLPCDGGVHPLNDHVLFFKSPDNIGFEELLESVKQFVGKCDTQSSMVLCEISGSPISQSFSFCGNESIRNWIV